MKLTVLKILHDLVSTLKLYLGVSKFSKYVYSCNTFIFDDLLGTVNGFSKLKSKCC